jgi:signal transduction histidine kinase
MSAAERAGIIVRNLQSFSKTQPQYSTARLDAPLEEAATLINHEMTKASLKLERDYQPVPEVRMDTGALAQVFLNLLINAVHATPAGGTVRLSVREEGDEKGTPGVAARVSDTGSGIPADVLPRVFEYAFSTKGDRGSGLGLAISKELVEAHGGRISVRTEAGKGTEFTVWLPKQARRVDE